jgi:hypothetical protein
VLYRNAYNEISSAIIEYATEANRYQLLRPQNQTPPWMLDKSLPSVVRMDRMCVDVKTPTVSGKRDGVG